MGARRVFEIAGSTFQGVVKAYTQDSSIAMTDLIVIAFPAATPPYTIASIVREVNLDESTFIATPIVGKVDLAKWMAQKRKEEVISAIQKDIDTEIRVTREDVMKEMSKKNPKLKALLDQLTAAEQ